MQKATATQCVYKGTLNAKALIGCKYMLLANGQGDALLLHLSHAACKRVTRMRVLLANGYGDTLRYFGMLSSQANNMKKKTTCDMFPNVQMLGQTMSRNDSRPIQGLLGKMFLLEMTPPSTKLAQIRSF